MAREIDEKKKRKALRKMRKALERAEANGTELSDWEKQFIDEVEERIETFGSAFHDVEKGALDEPLSALQQMKLKEIDKKSRGELRRSGFKSKKTDARRPKSRDIHEDFDSESSDASEKLPTRRRLIAVPKEPVLSEESGENTKSVETDRSAPTKKRRFRVIDGGKADDGSAL